MPRQPGFNLSGHPQHIIQHSKEYLLFCHRYIELNPVRADMVEHPSKYRWSSYRHNAPGKSDIVVPHIIYKDIDPDKNGRLKGYGKLFGYHLSDEILKSVRDATNKPWALGGGRFVEQIEKPAKRQAIPKAGGGDRKSDEYQKHGINRV